jgi:protein gp37
MGKTTIEWTDDSWNPTIGCTRISPGCKSCYAFTLHDKRHAAHKAGKKMPPQYARPFTELQLIEDRLTDPLHWRKPRKVFVNSVSDLFHEDIPDAFIDRVFAVMALAGRHTFQVLTKRANRMLSYMQQFSPKRLENAARTVGHTLTFKGLWTGPAWPLPNVWLGVSVEDQKHGLPRVDLLREAPAAIRFLSVEPLLEDLGSLNLAGIRWVIVGGESGGNGRPMHPEWARGIRDQCQATDTPFFFKQWGNWAPNASGELVWVGEKDIEPVLDGRTWDEYPATEGT